VRTQASPDPPRDSPPDPASRLRLTEIFFSLQGEGIDQGLPTVFIRLSGCSLRCAWCDTAYSFLDGEERALRDVLAHAATFGVRRACITGGEPLDQREGCVELLRGLLSRDWSVVLETSGGVPINDAAALEPRNHLCVSLDVKCPSSNMQGRNVWDNLKLLRAHDQVKFVIADDADYDYALDILRTHDIPCHVVFNPMWSPPPDAPGLRFLERTHPDAQYMSLKRLAEKVLGDRLDVRVGTQLHKLIWGMERGR
jgi:7-carboxy-7-deazaguanine synthase